MWKGDGNKYLIARDVNLYRLLVLLLVPSHKVFGWTAAVQLA